ncbi:MAG: thiamine pyrophosphate-dependent dehydrogenase E1 component subunit alpha [Myxococcales bacterium]|nr:thiamine pyrophosphate-dependent dehydrogenase E1 component subunit alpha [Myxococcota bacterium]MDW8281533.1 thiamine pyrophosphate-dependent dehydrogenase E1 component subunit alpha [Myxococcales bacterium]
MLMTTDGPSPPQDVPEPFWLLDLEGRLRPGVDPQAIPQVSDEDCRRLLRAMLQVRIVDDRMMKLQRQGRLGFYMQSTGEEATHFGVAYVLRPSDWVFPSYREPGVAFWRGYTLRAFTNQLFGNAEDPVRGRQMPVHHSFRAGNFVSISSPVGTQIPQAVGAAMAARILRRDDVVVVYFGEGTASTGDFHVGMNFAGVFRSPVVFVCRNNGWAISTPGHLQTAAPTVAQKAVAYGFPGARVDGNDLLAMIAATQAAVNRARAGEGPTLLEAVTYRRAAHSSSDDPSVYRDPQEPKQWEERDPIERWRRYLKNRGIWEEAWEARVREEIVEAVQDALQHAEQVGPPPLDTLFEDVYAQMPANLREQREELLALPRQKSPHA